jgi:putative hemolysin
MLWFEILVVLSLVLLNGFFAMSELAVVSARRARLQGLAEDGKRGAKIALALQADPTRFLSTVQIGITLIGVLERFPFIWNHSPRWRCSSGTRGV